MNLNQARVIAEHLGGLYKVLEHKPAEGDLSRAYQHIVRQVQVAFNLIRGHHNMAEFQRGTYKGPLPDLKGKTALLKPDDKVQTKTCTTIMAQFDDLGCTQAHGWWPHPLTDFEIHEV